MLGNQLNPNSNMAQKMSDHLNSELEAHSIFNPNENSNLVGPQLHQRVIASVFFVLFSVSLFGRSSTYFSYVVVIVLLNLQLVGFSVKSVFKN